MPGLSPAELGVVAVVLLLIMKEVINFLKWIVNNKFASRPSESRKGEAKHARQEAFNEATLAKLVETGVQQTAILHQLSALMLGMDSRFREFVSDFKAHEKDMRHPHKFGD